MKLSLQEVMANKDDEELENNLINITKYTSEAIHALVDELKKLNRQFTPAELENIEAVVQRKLEEEKNETNSLSRNQKWEKTSSPILMRLNTIQKRLLTFSLYFSLHFLDPFC